MLTNPNGSTKRFDLTTVTNTSRQILAYHTFGRQESLTIRFLGNWLDLTDAVTVSGSGIIFNGIVGRGKNRLSNQNEIPYCDVRFQIFANVRDGIRTIRLRRPAPFFRRHQTVYTINLQRNIRISSNSPSPVLTSNQFGNMQRFSLEGEGFDRWLRTDQPRVPPNSILSGLLLFTTNNPNRYNFRVGFRSAGSLTYASLFNDYLIMTTGTKAVHMGPTLFIENVALVSIQPPPPLIVNPTAINFGNICVGDRITRFVTITNNTSNDYQISRLILLDDNGNTNSSSVFSPVQLLPITIPAGGYSEVGIRFMPTRTDDYSGRLVVSHTAGGDLDIPLSGSTASPLSVAPKNIDFGSVNMGTTNTRQLTITNSCSNPITINSIALRTQGTPFTLSGVVNSIVVPPNGSISTNVVYACTVAGRHSNTITITPAVGDPMNVSLSGTCITGNPELSVNLLNTFDSSETIINSDREGYNLCPIQTRDDIPINTEIPRVQIRITNYGTADSPNTTLTFQRGNNSNYPQGNVTIVVPVIPMGQTRTLEVPLGMLERLNSLVCTIRRRGTCLRCNTGINPHWNDRGNCVSLQAVPGDTNTFDDRFCVPN